MGAKENIVVWIVYSPTGIVAVFLDCPVWAIMQGYTVKAVIL